MKTLFGVQKDINLGDYTDFQVCSEIELLKRQVTTAASRNYRKATC